MRILHYALGFPPYRSGGMTKFCVDLMMQQAKEGHTAAMLWSGRMRLFNKKIIIKKHENVVLQNYSVQSFEIINPLPVPFDEGIADITAFTADGGRAAYAKMLGEFRPDVVHIHTFMGLHKSFLDEVKGKGVRLVFTAHDFFPLCPKVTMFRQGAVCKSAKTCKECGICNTTALSLRKIQLLQSPVYKKIKDVALIKKIRKQHRDRYLDESTVDVCAEPVGTAEDYQALRAVYASFLDIMDVIHYNSSVTREVYQSFFHVSNDCVINITHTDMKDHRKIKHFSGEKLRIRYLGPMGKAKGFFLLQEALDMLWSRKQNFCLDVHFTPKEKTPYIKVHDRYSYGELEKIFEETDVLVAPSMWYETFGFTVLEALSYGVPVIVSGTVGAKDILTNGAGIVIDDMDAEKLCEALQNMTPEKLKKMNQVIVEKQSIMQIEDMSKEIEKLCYGWEGKASQVGI